MLAINLSSTSFTKRVTAIIMAGTKPADAVKEAIAQLEAEQAVKAATAQAKAAIFATKIEMEQEIKVPSNIIEAVRAEYERRAYQKANKQEVTNYACFISLRVSSAWRKASWTEGACYASAKTIEILKKAYSL